jgi:hypothetical protein
MGYVFNNNEALMKEFVVSYLELLGLTTLADKDIFRFVKKDEQVTMQAQSHKLL